MSLETSEKQVISKRRVTDHGEVFTNQREVKAMRSILENVMVREVSTRLHLLALLHGPRTD